jgi:hypothetical protein
VRLIPLLICPLLFSADCCDGTDELSGCKNTCIEKNSAKRDAIKRQIDDYKAALDRRGQYASSAHGVRENIKQRFANVDSEIEKAEQELQRLAGGPTGAECVVCLPGVSWSVGAVDATGEEIQCITCMRLQRHTSISDLDATVSCVSPVCCWESIICMLLGRCQ